MAFRGTFDHTLDAKNRLTVPAKFRAALADGVVLARGSERCVEVWPAADYERLHGAAFDTELDGAGRVGLPPKLLEHAGLAREVAIVGAGDSLEIWDRGAWSSVDEDSPDRINELTRSLGHPS